MTVDLVGVSGAPSAVPWTVRFVNVVSSFAIGVSVGVGASENVRLVAGIGFLGGFTTFSTFSLDVFADLEAGRSGRALALVVLTVGLAIGAAAAGWALARA